MSNYISKMTSLTVQDLESIQRIACETGLTDKHCKAVIIEAQRLISELGHVERYQSLDEIFSAVLTKLATQ